MSKATLNQWKRQLALRHGYNVSRCTSNDMVRETVSYLRPQVDPLRLVRLGAEGDGGYLVPDDLKGIEACFSPGVNDQVAFEVDLMALGIPSHLCDASIERVPATLSGFTFEKKFLGLCEEGNFTTLCAWFARYASVDDAHDYMLQMDIEGAEYDVLNSTPRDVLRKFRIIVIELHHFARVFDPLVCQQIHTLLSRLARDFVVAHIHGNNHGDPVSNGTFEVPRSLEVSLLRRDRPWTESVSPSLPHQLDRPCVSHRPEVVLDRTTFL